MARAIHENRKTMTRRVIKPQPLDIHGSAFMKTTKCPYGQPGDRLWVRETFAESRSGVIYRAAPMFDDCEEGDVSWKWKPSIHMPRWASRITLEITAVRVERLQDISEEDAKREGFPDVVHFYELWTILNGKESWRANPWVWVVEFKVAQA